MPRHPPAPTAPDGALAAVAAALTAVTVWLQPDPIGTPVAGPRWFLLLFPLLFAAPLAWRRTAPLAAVSVSMGAIVVQAVLTGDSPEGLDLILVMAVQAYSVAAYSERRRAVLGLAVAIVGYGIYSAGNHDIRSGRAGELWAGSFFLAALLALWLLGVFMRGRRDERRRGEQEAAGERERRLATEEERSRLARELHDVISHTLSVVVLQAAGARAAGAASPETLEKIENSGRASLAEMRRLLEVLRREQDDDGGVAPQPGVGDLARLVRQLTDAGLPVDLTVDPECENLSGAFGLSVYRIVQESLTNVLKHAGPARAAVAVRADPEWITVDVVDDGSDNGAAVDTTGGHGLVGMRERVALFGGNLTVGPRPEGGFAVHARLPRDARRA